MIETCLEVGYCLNPEQMFEVCERWIGKIRLFINSFHQQDMQVQKILESI